MAQKSNEQKKVNEPKVKNVSTFTKLRYNHKFRLIFIFILMVIVAVMFFFWKKMRIALVVIFITLLAAFGLEATKNDWDLKKLIEQNPSSSQKYPEM
jgi:ABC-type multidrug transport system fused ATPase/permease subunit